MALAMVPLRRQQEGIEILESYIDKVDPLIKDQVDAFWKYYTDTWLYGDFNPKEWNFFGSEENRTNNPSEGKSLICYIVHLLMHLFLLLHCSI